jgi:hypothetical protein
MLDANVTAENRSEETIEAVRNQKPAKMAVWETPTLEDVSEQVMAQPYIRFT